MSHEEIVKQIITYIMYVAGAFGLLELLYVLCREFGDDIITAMSNKRRKKKMDELVEYLRKNLGVRGNLRLKEISLNRIMIFLDDEYFGIFDTKRKTFVD